MSKQDMVSAEELDKQLAEAARQDAEEFKSQGPRISIKGSRFRQGDDELGKEMTVVVVATAREQAWFDSVYDPSSDKASPPACFSISKRPFGPTNNVEPHEDSPVPQETSCNDCDLGKWHGKDKPECKSGLRLMLLAYGEKLETSEMVSIKCPPGSIKNYANYASAIARQSGRPVYAHVTQVGFDPNSDNPKLVFKEADAILTKEEIIEAMYVSQNTGTVDLLMAPYNVESYEAPAPKATRKKRAPRRKSKMS